MKTIIRSYNELSKDELYAILKSRMQVFVVEQHCPYQDIDGLDDKSLHIFLEEDGLLAYLRLFPKDEKTVQMGRVLTLVRNRGYGRKILQEGIQAAKTCFKAEEIYLEAQVYAMALYAREGFTVCGEEFLEDGIPHIPMKLKL